MVKKQKIILISIMIAISSLLIVSIGLTAAIWEGQGGDTGFAPALPITDWNSWAKYYEYEDVEGGVAITGYSGTNLENVVIPSQIEGKNVVEIKNTIFSNTTLKELPVTLKISPNIKKIDVMAFSNLPNLEKVVFGTSRNETTDKSSTCAVGQNVFSGCKNLKTIELQGWRKVSFEAYAFSGCFLLQPISNNDGFANVTYFSNALKGSSLG